MIRYREIKASHRYRRWLNNSYCEQDTTILTIHYIVFAAKIAATVIQRQRKVTTSTQNNVRFCIPEPEVSQTIHQWGVGRSSPRRNVLHN